MEDIVKMKKIIALVLAVTALFSLASCGKKEETVSEHNKKLVSGEVDPDVKKVDKDDNDNEDNKNEDHADENKDEEKSEEDNKISDSSNISINIPEDELAKLVDEADDEYESFEVVDMPSADFFMGKKLNAVAALSNHEMTMIEKGAVTMEINNTNIVFDYLSSDGQQQQSAFVYKISPEILKTSAGRDYTYVVYGTEPITEGEISGTVGVLRVIKLRDDVDMGENKADTYVLYEETAQSGSYYIMTVE